MAKRRKRAKASTTAIKHTTKKKPRPAIVGDSAPGMSYPNHLVPTLRDWKNLFPLLQLQHGCGDNYHHVFYDHHYGVQFEDWPLISTPPTWMDPEFFVNAVRKDPKVIELLGALDKHNDLEKGKAAVYKELDRIIDAIYIPMLYTRFEKSKQVIAEWVVGNHCDQRLNTQATEYSLKQCARRRKQKGIELEDIIEPDEEEDD